MNVKRVHSLPSAQKTKSVAPLDTFLLTVLASYALPMPFAMKTKFIVLRDCFSMELNVPNAKMVLAHLFHVDLALIKSSNRACPAHPIPHALKAKSRAMTTFIWQPMIVVCRVCKTPRARTIKFSAMMVLIFTRDIAKVVRPMLRARPMYSGAIEDFIWAVQDVSRVL